MPKCRWKPARKYAGGGNVYGVCIGGCADIRTWTVPCSFAAVTQMQRPCPNVGTAPVQCRPRAVQRPPVQHSVQNVGSAPVQRKIADIRTFSTHMEL
jgi:hypothetical protein